tara:strand:- start:148 stop:1341 length:1194 start_codon:yes stop_codon:yes gene_type:complete
MELIIRTDQMASSKWIKKVLTNDFVLIEEDIPKAGSPDFLNLTEKLKNILRLDKPDIIISKIKDGLEKPLVSIELSACKLQSQHIEQRMARIVAAAENGVPAMYICGKELIGTNGKLVPFDPKHYDLMYKIGDINEVPTFFYHWPTRGKQYIHEIGIQGSPPINDPEIQKAISMIKILINEENNLSRTFSYFNNDKIEKEFSNLKLRASGKKYDLYKMAYKKDGNPIKSSTLLEINTSELLSFLSNYMDRDNNWIKKSIESFPKRILGREKTIIFKPNTTKSRMFIKAGDPYVGMIASFDYAFCRTGKTVDQRSKNLIYMPLNEDDSYMKKTLAKDGFNKFYKKDCPFKSIEAEKVQDQFKIAHHLQYGCTFTKIKPMKIYSNFTDLMVFKDSLLVF